MSIRVVAAWIIISIVMGMTLYAAADTVCQVQITGDVLKLNGLVQPVPLSAVGVAREVGYAVPDITTTGSTRATPAIVFVIDDSGSMMQNDKDANRYAVTKEILDEIYREAPGTRVAVVTFRNWLAWDWRDNGEFQRIASPFASNDSYFPLAPLDSVYSDGTRTIDKIEKLFTLDQWNLLQAFHSDSTERTRPQEYDESGKPLPMTRNQQGTDITLAFMAAKSALRATATPVERQFIIFLSDGFHGSVDVEMEATKTDYISAKGVPTTYTIFLGDSVKTPPQQLLTMVSNIQGNGYSSSNPKSQLWSIASTHDTLLALMQREILTEVYAPLRSATKARSGSTATARITGDELIFDHPFALAPDTTIITFEVVFPLTDPKGNSKGDTVLTSTVTFIRDGKALYSSMDSGLSPQCYLRNIELSSDGVPIRSSIRNQQTSLTAELTLEGIDAASQQMLSVAVEKGADALTTPLAYRSALFEGTVSRVMSETVVTDDKIVQHQADARLSFTWRNQWLPLDTLLRVYGVSPYDPVVITAVKYVDADRNGLIDAVVVTTDRAINSREFETLDASRLKLPQKRTLSIDSVSASSDKKGFIMHVTATGTGMVNTGVTDDDILDITDYEVGPYGDYVEAGQYQIADGMAPVLTAATFITDKKGDRFAVTFSEPVKAVTAVVPFRFTAANGTSYRLELVDPQSNDREVTFTVKHIAPEGVVPGPGDSVWIADAARIGDTVGNVQVEPNRKVPLVLEGLRIDFSVLAGPNPVVRSSNRSIRVPGFGTIESGTVIEVRPGFPASDIRTLIDKVEVRIYDAVGNLLAVNPPEKVVDSGWYIHWNCTNRNGRTVGPGVYLAVLHFEAHAEMKTESFTKSVKIAVR